MAVHPTTKYAIDVVDGRIVAGPYVRGACQRHLNDLKDGHKRGFHFDEERADHALNFFPIVLRLNGGEFEGNPFELHPSQQFIVGSLFGWIRDDGFRRFRVAYIEQAKGQGKALALDTPIPTPSGWTTMGDLRPGDTVFDDRGEPCQVLAESKVMHDRPCYRVTFSDGESIVADAEHLWRTSALRGGDSRKGPKDPSIPRKGQTLVRTTAQIAATLKPWTYAGGADNIQAKWNHRIEVAPALELPDIELPIAPYTLGIWLGDGDSDCSRITTADPEILELIRSDGYSIGELKTKPGTTAVRVKIGGNNWERDGLQSVLRKNDLLLNKHIPRAYFRAGTSQRLELLQGLMDSDGSISGGQCEITLCNERLANDVLELIRSLGFKVVIRESDACINGRVVGRRWRMMFKAYRSFPPFCLNRKAIKLDREPATRALSRGRMIVGCDIVESAPVKCIAVSSESSMFLIGKTLIPTHNSPLLAGIGLYGIVGDREPRAEVYSAGSKKDQAMILFRDAVSMVRLSPALNARFKMSGRDDKVWNLFDPVTNSFFRPISAEQGQSGPRPHIGLIDELHEHKSPVVMNMMSAGRKSRRQPLIVAITNSGFDQTSVCWEYHEKAVNVCTKGDIDDAFFAYVCSLDPGEDPFHNEECWVKANPLLGVTITKEYLRDEVIAGRSMPSKESLVRRLNFCQWTQAENPLIPGGAWEKAEARGEATFDLKKFKGVEGHLGLDLSAVGDLTAAVFVFRKSGLFFWWPEFWIPLDRLKEKIEKDKVPYDDWVRKGWVRTIPGKSINLDFVARDIRNIIKENGLKIIEAPYDRWKIEDFEAAAGRVDLNIPLVEFGQGFKDMGPAVDSFEKALTENLMRHNGNPCLRWNAANAIVDQDPAGNRKFNKGKAKGKRIDGIVAGCMAHHRATLRPEAPPELRIRWA